MARKKSKSIRIPRLSTLLWLMATAVSGGSIGGYFNPHWPIIGPLVQRLQIWKDASPTAAGGIADSGAGSGGGAGAGGAAFSNAATTPQLISTQRPSESIRIATFNIQVFGQSKMSKPDVVNVLVQIIRQFDLVAIQEVRAQQDDILPRFVEAINADGHQYDFLIGPRIGRTVSTEQYAFVYDKTRIELDPSLYGTLPDPNDLLHREPFAARFRPRTSMPEKAFTFWLVDIHTDPDEVAEEVSALADVFVAMQSARPDEDDVILLGDLNADETQLGPLGQIPGIRWVVSGTVTNTRKTKAYDNILFDGQATSEYTGVWGVFDMASVFGLSEADALKVSDHMPVWAEFSIWEAPQRANFADRVPDYRR